MVIILTGEQQQSNQQAFLSDLPRRAEGEGVKGPQSKRLL